MKLSVDPRRWLERDPGPAIVLAVAFALVVAGIVPWGPALVRGIEPEGFSVWPRGEEVSRLAPVKVVFKRPLSGRDGATLLRLDPPVEGDYAWAGARTLLFQPRFPGLLRGWQYTVNVAAAPEAGLDQPYSSRFTTAGALTVQTVIPAPDDVEVPAAAQVLVQFSRSVAPLTLLREQSTKPVVEFEPALPGTGEWLNTSVYRFIPDALPGMTTFRARIRAGLSSAVDGVLKQDFTWSFTTFSPALESVTPDDNSQFASFRQKVTLRFNLPMDRGSVAASVRLRSADGAEVPGSFSWDPRDTVATFTPATLLTRGTRYQVVVPKGLRSASGGTSETERTASFTTFPEPRVERTTPSDGATNASRYGISVQFTNPMNPKSFAGRVSVSGIDPDKLTTDWFGDRVLAVNATLRPSTKYTVRIAPGGADREGQAFGAYSFSFTTGAITASVSIVAPGLVGGGIATYSSSAEPILYFRAMNLPAVAFALYPLTASERDQILARNSLFQGSSTPFAPSSAPLRSWTKAVRDARDQVVIGSSSLSGGGPLAKGDYFIRVRGGAATFGGDLAFSVVDTVIATKLSNDELLAWVLDHDSGKALPGVTVQASGSGLPSTTLTTDASGLAAFAIPNLAAGNERPGLRSYAILVDDAGRHGVASTYWSQGIQPYQLAIPMEFAPRRFVGHVYTERPLYRPGEEVFYKAIVRVDDDAAYEVPPADVPFEVLVADPQGRELAREKVTLNEFGTFAASLRLPGTAAIGEYRVTLRTSSGPDWQRQINGTGFSVAEFRKPEFQVDLETDRAAYISGERISAKAVATYFFGGALAGAPARWSVTSSPFRFSLKGYERYSFTEYDYYARPAVARDPIRAQGAAVTGASGSAEFVVPAVVQADEGALQYTISATVTDQNQQTVSANGDVIVHRAELYAGVRLGQYVVEAGRPARIDLVTSDTSGKLLPGRPVKVLVYERTWVTTKEETPDGSRRYRSEPVDTLLETLDATTDAKSEATLSYTPTRSGSLRVVAEVRDARGRVSRSANFIWVAGGGYASWRVTNDDTVALVADKDSYQVGDTAEVLVPAPFAGVIGLVTVERGRILTRETRTFATNSERLRVPIVDRDVPNVFVSVVLYRPPTAQDPVPRYKVGYVQLPVATRSRELSVAVRPDRERARPGDRVGYDLRVTDSAGKGVRADLSVAVVDKAVLSLMEERTPTGLRAFWFQRGLGVTTASSLAVSVNRANDAIVEGRSESKGGATGGGLAPERLRQDFKNVAFWQGQLVTREDGTARVEVPLPDDLTTWRMQVRAVSGSTMVGEGTNELLSTQPLLLRPSLPRFLRVGDKATLRLLVRNGTRTATGVKVTLAAQGVDVAGELERAGSVGPEASVIFDWPATVATDGTARLSFRAVGDGGLADAVELRIPVARDVTPETTATGGVITGEEAYEGVYLPAYAIRDAGGLDVTVQASLTGSMSAELASFAKHPREFYEDSVKVASRVIATLGVRRADRSVNPQKQALDSQIQTDLATIIGRQNSDGGWSWCPVSACQSDAQVTGWVLVALGEARRDGRPVDESTLNSASTWVGRYLTRLTDVERPADVNEKAALLYAIAVAGQAPEYLPQMRALVEQYRAKLANFGRAYLVLGMAEAGQTKSDSYMSRLLNDLAGAMTSSATGNHWEDTRYAGSTHTNTRTTALVLDALVRADSRHPLIAETVRWLMVARGANGWEGYAERAQAVLALSEFAAKTRELGADYGYTVRLGERDVLTGRFKPADGRNRDTTTVPLAQLESGKVTVLGLTREAARGGRMYYSVDLRYVTPARSVEALNRGIAVTHEYSSLNEPGRRLDRAKLGDTVRVKVTVIAPSDLNYVVVEDFLPGGFEPIDPRLRTTDAALRARLEQERIKLARKGELDYWAPWFRWYYSPWQQTELRDDRVTLRAQRLPKGVHEFVYYARATSPGDYFVAPAHAEETFFPEVFGRSDSARFVIEP